MNRRSLTAMNAPVLEVHGLDVETAAGRPLIRRLSLTLGRERLALIGRNGAGKSSLLNVFAGEQRPVRGEVNCRGSVLLVPQDLARRDVANAARALERGVGRLGGIDHLDRKLSAARLPCLAELSRGIELSIGEQRKLLLCHAELLKPDLLLLDEPSQDLDEAGCLWLRGWLGAWERTALVVSHDRSLLRLFGDFMIIAESGCHHLAGTLEDVEQQLVRAEEDHRRDYVRRLNTLVQEERHSEQFRKRRARKKNVGRIRELGRLTPRQRLNQKRGYAQEKQARIEGVRRERIAKVRDWAKAARRALSISLPVTEVLPRLGSAGDTDIVVLENVAVDVGGRRLFSALSLRVRRERVAVMGANGTGKTTLLRTILRQHPVAEGLVRTQVERVGSVAQGAIDWMGEESLLEQLAFTRGDAPDVICGLLAAHRFPLALAMRPLASLSPGERFRGALIGLLERNPPAEVLVLDEPSYGLDFVGLAALREFLRAWQGGLIVVSHDRELLQETGIHRWICLDGAAGEQNAGPSLGIEAATIDRMLASDEALSALAGAGSQPI